MADENTTTTNPLLSFGYGLKANLPSAKTHGKIYITSDTKEMYIDLPGADDRICLSNFRIGTALPATGEEGQFFIKTTTADNKTTYALYAHDGTTWKEIVDTAAIADLTDRIDTLEDWQEDLESGIEASYVKKAGDTMTGSLTMQQTEASGSQAAIRATVTGLPAPNDDTDAANKQYVDEEVADLKDYVDEELDKKAPTNHADAATTYGIGTNALYGHVKLSDSTSSSTAAASGGTAATPKAVKDTMEKAASAYSLAEQAKNVADAALPATSLPGELAKYMPLTGGTFTGNVVMADNQTLTVNAPSADAHATTKKYVDDAIATVNSGVEDLEKEIDNLTNIMNFLGTTTTALSDGSTTSKIIIDGEEKTAVKGDVVVNGNKEFVFDGSKWAEIGDVSAQATAITDLQDTVGTKPTGTGDPEMDDKLWDEVADLRTDLGERTDDKNKATAFGRIKALEEENATQNSAIVGLGNQLTWSNF